MARYGTASAPTSGTSAEYEKSARAFERAVEVDPKNAFAFANWGRCSCRLASQKRQSNDAAKRGPTTGGVKSARRSRTRLSAAGARAGGDPGHAGRGRGRSPVQVGLVFACWGRVDEAFAHFEQGVAAHARMLHDSLRHPCIEAIRSDPRWASIRKKMNLRQTDGGPPLVAPDAEERAEARLCCSKSTVNPTWPSPLGARERDRRPESILPVAIFILGSQERGMNPGTLVVGHAA